VFQDGSGGPPSFERRRPENRTPCPRIPTRRQRRKTRPRRTEVRARLAGLRSRGARAHTKVRGRAPSVTTAGSGPGTPGLRGAPKRATDSPPGLRPARHSSGSRRPTRGEVRSVVRALLNPRPATVPDPKAKKDGPFTGARAAAARTDTESPRSTFRAPPVYPRTVSRTLELSLQSSFQLSLTVLVCYRSRGHI
jgi:hypothetical protein